MFYYLIKLNLIWSNMDVGLRVGKGKVLRVGRGWWGESELLNVQIKVNEMQFGRFVI